MIRSYLHNLAKKYRKVENTSIKIILQKLHWHVRTKDVLDSNFLTKFEFIRNSGTITNQFQFMHQGIKVPLHAYCGPLMTNLIQKAKGVHEPEEEYYFNKMLSSLNVNSTILELGSYWAYYSAWFLTICENGYSVCIDTIQANLEIGKNTYELNNVKERGTFLKGFISKKINLIDNTYTIDYLISTYFNNKLSVLHSDIQGHELDMLKGSENSLKNNAIDYIFISTHSDELHNKCKVLLQNYDYIINVDINLENSSSFDGLIIASSPSVINPF